MAAEDAGLDEAPRENGLSIKPDSPAKCRLTLPKGPKTNVSTVKEQGGYAINNSAR